MKINKLGIKTSDDSVNLLGEWRISYSPGYSTGITSQILLKNDMSDGFECADLPNPINKFTSNTTGFSDIKLRIDS